MNSKLLLTGTLVVALVATASAAGGGFRGRQLGRKAPGTKCGSDSDCASGACAQGKSGKYVCCTGKNNWSRLGSFSNWCIKQPTGGACWHDDDQCASGWCDKTWCRPLMSTGARCEQDKHCSSGACAQGHKGVNVCCSGKNNWSKMGTLSQWCIKQPEGKACADDDDQCANGLYCDSKSPGASVCRKKREGGQECDRDDQCGSGACAQGQAGLKVCCQGKDDWSDMWTTSQWCINQPDGEACADDNDQCKEGLYCRGNVCKPKLDAREHCNPNKDECASTIQANGDVLPGVCGIGSRRQDRAAICCPSGRADTDLFKDGDSVMDTISAGMEWMATIGGARKQWCLGQQEQDTCETDMQCEGGNVCVRNRCEKTRAGRSCGPITAKRGFWKPTLDSVNAGTTRTISVGTTVASSDSYTTWRTPGLDQRITSSLETGFNVGPVDATTPVSDSSSKTVVALSSLSFTTPPNSKSPTATSTTEVFAQDGVGWQWQFDTTDTCGTSKVLTSNVIVTNTAAQPPACLPGFFAISGGVRNNFECACGTPNLNTGTVTPCPAETSV